MMPGMMGPEAVLEETKDYEVRFFTYDKGMEPFIELLKSTLPLFSKTVIQPDLSVVAVYTSPEGQEKAACFIDELESLQAQRMHDRDRERADENSG